jgi:4-hydroxybenzoate polyprenyltransferase
LREILYIVAPMLGTLTGLAAFLTWWTAGLYVTSIILVTIYTIRKQEKRLRAPAFGDGLSHERIEAARKWLSEN